MIRPNYLKKGDTVAIVALASKLNIEEIRPAIDLMQNDWGLNVVVGESVSAAYFGFAGDDETRRRDFQQMIDNEEVKAIFSARGGYGSSRIIDSIDFTEFKKNPKWIIGFSDITAVHCHLQAMDYESLHAAMPKTMMKDDFSRDSLRKLLFGEELSYKANSHELNRLGTGKGELIGGNLCLLAHLLGSDSEPDTKNKILFIEDISEYLYNIDRMMVQLKRAGKLKDLAGLIVGDFSDSKENDEPFGKTVYEIIAEHTAEYNYPISFGFPVGHESVNWAMPCGRMAELAVMDGEVKLRF
ncbi:MAG: LD-carboxypeptidase [Spirosomataceae bacterium]